jgi:hypothetical protein
VEACAFPGSSLFSNDLAGALKFLRHLLVGRNNLVESVRDFAGDSSPVSGQAHGEIAVPHGLKTAEDQTKVLGNGRRPIASFFFQGGSERGIGTVDRCALHCSLHKSLSPQGKTDLTFTEASQRPTTAANWIFIKKGIGQRPTTEQSETFSDNSAIGRTEDGCVENYVAVLAEGELRPN